MATSLGSLPGFLQPLWNGDLHHTAPMAVAVLACGTRGDVQPMMALAVALSDSLDVTVTFITHAAHQASGGQLGSGVQALRRQRVPGVRPRFMSAHASAHALASAQSHTPHSCILSAGMAAGSH